MFIKNAIIIDCLIIYYRILKKSINDYKNKNY